MYIRTFFAALVLGVGLLSAQANAALVATSWKTQGDNLSVLDSVTGKEWLDLSLTRGKTLPEINNLLSTTYQGWRLPTAAEVYSLMMNSVGTTFNVAFGPGKTDWIERVGGAPSSVGGFYSQFGYTSTYFCCSGLFRLMSIGRHYTIDGSSVAFSGVDHNSGSGGHQVWGLNALIDDNAYNLTNMNGSYVIANTGVFLVNDGGVTLSSIQNPNLNINNPNAPVNQVTTPPVSAVPVHAGYGLLGLLLMAFGAHRRNAK